MMLLPVDSRFSMSHLVQDPAKFRQTAFLPNMANPLVGASWFPSPVSSHPNLMHPVNFLPPAFLRPAQLSQAALSMKAETSRTLTTSTQKPKIFRPWVVEDDAKNEESMLVKSECRESGSSNADSSPSSSKSTASPDLQPPLKNYVPNTSDPHLEEHSALEIIATNLGKSSGGHRCIYCGKVYSRKYGLKIHLRTHTGFKPLQCRICGRAFGDPSNLNKHTRLHTDNGQQFKCQLCHKVLIRKRDLERHLLSRHSIRLAD